MTAQRRIRQVAWRSAVVALIWMCVGWYTDFFTREFFLKQLKGVPHLLQVNVVEFFISLIVLAGLMFIYLVIVVGVICYVARTIRFVRYCFDRKRAGYPVDDWHLIFDPVHWVR